MGDPNGIGPEVILKFLATNRERTGGTYVLVGSANVVQHYADLLGLHGALDNIEVMDLCGDVAVRHGVVSAEAGSASMVAVREAVDLCLAGSVDAMVTAPISKEAIAEAGYSYPGHTEFIAERCESSYAMVMIAPGLRVGLLTSHIPLNRVSSSITVDLIVDKVELLHQSLRFDFGIAAPSIALLGLNPHAGDGGVLGLEEQILFAPAIADLAKNGIRVGGPFPADGFFGRRTYLEFDGVMAAYHDQGLVAFKALSFGKGVNFTAGLPIVRTSPDHGTAFGIAGRGVADEGSFRAAALQAAEIVASRTARA